MLLCAFWEKQNSKTFSLHLLCVNGAPVKLSTNKSALYGFYNVKSPDLLNVTLTLHALLTQLKLSKKVSYTLQRKVRKPVRIMG